MKNNLKSLTSVLDDLREQGYTHDFRFEKNKLLSFDTPTKHYVPHDVTIEDIYRFEGNTDPADDAVLYVITTSDGKKGSISNGYRAFANVELDEFMNQAKSDVEAIAAQKG